MEHESAIPDFKISDIYLSATLITFGFKLTGIERGDGPRALFLFADNPRLLYYQEAFYRDELKVNPRDVLRTLKELKHELYDGAR